MFENMLIQNIFEIQISWNLYCFKLFFFQNYSIMSYYFVIAGIG